MTMQPKAGIATPQGNGKPAKEVFGGGGGVRRAGTISNLKVKLMEEFEDQVPPTTRFSVGYFGGEG